MNSRNWKRSLLVASLFAALLSIISLAVEWKSAQTVTLRISVVALGLVLASAVASYVLRILRFYLLLEASGVPVSLPGAALAQGVGFALSVTPGSIGDLFKLQFIRERAGTSLVRGAPALVLDRLLEGAGFMVLVLLSASALPAMHAQALNALAWFGPSLLLIPLLIWLGRMPRIRVRLDGFLCPFSSTRRLRAEMRNMARDVRSTATARRLAWGLALTGLARLADGLVLLFAAQMMGISLALPLAVFVVTAGGLAGGVSLLPGGTGAAEAAMAGLLMAAGATFATALAIALLARFCTLWLWVGLGLGEALTCQFAPAKVE